MIRTSQMCEDLRTEENEARNDLMRSLLKKKRKITKQMADWPVLNLEAGGPRGPFLGV